MDLSDILSMTEGGEPMTTESSRLILGLRAKGWTDTEIADFILWIETGEGEAPAPFFFLDTYRRLCYDVSVKFCV